MTCRDVEARITAYLDGELDPTAASALRGHLRACEACRTMADDHARIAGSLAELAPVDPPPALWDGVMARLAEAEQADAKRSRLALWLAGAWARLRPQLGPVALAGVAVAVGVVWVAKHRAAEPDDPAPAARVAATVDDDLAAPPAAEPVDVATALAAERARIDDRYAGAVAELLDEAGAERAVWPVAQQRAFDAELARLTAAVDAVPLPGPAPAADFDETEAIAAAAEARERAWQRLIGFLQRAALGELVAMEVRR